MHNYSLWRDLSCSQQACYRFLKIIISVGVLIWVVNLTLQSNRTKTSHWPRAQFRTQELSLDLPGVTDNKECLTDFASIWCLLFISLQQLFKKSLRQITFIQLKTEYMLFQTPFIAAHKNRPVLEQAVFLKHGLQSHENTEPTETLQSPQIMQHKYIFLSQPALQTQRVLGKLLGKKTLKKLFY